VPCMPWPPPSPAPAPSDAVCGDSPHHVSACPAREVPVWGSWGVVILPLRKAPQSVKQAACKLQVPCMRGHSSHALAAVCLQSRQQPSASRLTGPSHLAPRLPPAPVRRYPGGSLLDALRDLRWSLGVSRAGP